MPIHKFTAQEYADLEAKADYRSEYYNGEIFAMAGGTDVHSDLCSAMIEDLRRQTRRGSCRVYTSDLRIHVRASGLQTYPDVSVVCGPRQYWEKRTDCIENPIVIVEVLSEGTAGYDRGKKFENYKLIDSLREYVLVWQTRIRMEVFRRDDGGEWSHEFVEGKRGKLTLGSIGATISLARAYSGIELPPEADW